MSATSPASEVKKQINNVTRQRLLRLPVWNSRNFRREFPQKSLLYANEGGVTLQNMAHFSAHSFHVARMPWSLRASFSERSAPKHPLITFISVTLDLQVVAFCSALSPKSGQCVSPLMIKTFCCCLAAELLAKVGVQSFPLSWLTSLDEESSQRTTSSLTVTAKLHYITQGHLDTFYYLPHIKQDLALEAESSFHQIRKQFLQLTYHSIEHIYQEKIL